MTAEDFYKERNDRQIRYAGRTLNPKQGVALCLDVEQAQSYDGQVTFLTAANLLSRMTPSLTLDVPQVEIIYPLPGAGEPLGEFVLNQISQNDPYNQFELRKVRDGDDVFFIGPNGHPINIHGSGWNAFVGSSPSPLGNSSNSNPVGPAFAAIMAIARYFKLGKAWSKGDHFLNAFTWSSNLIEGEHQPYIQEPKIGDLWVIGAGSVGSSALYFLPFATNNFTATVVDMDQVKLHNLDRSPIFTADDAANFRYKADVAANYLRKTGVEKVTSRTVALHQTEWIDREAGSPDLIVSTANEQNVRYFIENEYPPLQIYGTTGKNWQSTLFTHIPMEGECSCCVFPTEIPKPTMQCAEVAVQNPENGEQVDASLPFLSFAAGLMTVAEIFKLPLEDHKPSSRRVMFEMTNEFRVIPMQKTQRQECLCVSRKQRIYHQMLSGSRYSHLSGPDIKSEKQFILK